MKMKLKSIHELEDNTILSIEDIAAMFACTPQTIARLFTSKKLKGSQINRKWYTTGENIRLYIQGE